MSETIRLHCQTEGSGPPLVFIHGLGGSSHDWEPQVSEFARDYRVLVVDLRGHGRSPRAKGPYSMKMLAQDVADVLHTQSVKSAHIVGISLGGGVAFQLALDHPELVKSLVIVNSGPHMVLDTFAMKFAIWLRFAILRVFGLPKMGAVVAKKLFPLQPELRTAFMERFANNDLGCYRATLRAFVGWTVLNRMGDIRVPLLALTADQDYTPVAYKQAYVDKVRGAKLVVIPDTHHALPMENPAAFNAALRDFLGGVP